MESGLATLRAAIQRLRGDEVAELFTPEHLQLLWDRLYWSEVTLKRANRQTLLDLNFPPGLVDALTNSEETAAAAAALPQLLSGACWSARSFLQHSMLNQHHKAARLAEPDTKFTLHSSSLTMQL